MKRLVACCLAACSGSPAPAPDAAPPEVYQLFGLAGARVTSVATGPLGPIVLASRDDGHVLATQLADGTTADLGALGEARFVPVVNQYRFVAGELTFGGAPSPLYAGDAGARTSVLLDAAAVGGGFSVPDPVRPMQLRPDGNAIALEGGCSAAKCTLETIDIAATPATAPVFDDPFPRTSFPLWFYLSDGTLAVLQPDRVVATVAPGGALTPAGLGAALDIRAAGSFVLVRTTANELYAYRADTGAQLLASDVSPVYAMLPPATIAYETNAATVEVVSIAGGDRKSVGAGHLISGSPGGHYVAVANGSSTTIFDVQTATAVHTASGAQALVTFGPGDQYVALTLGAGTPPNVTETTYAVNLATGSVTSSIQNATVELEDAAAFIDPTHYLVFQQGFTKLIDLATGDDQNVARAVVYGTIFPIPVDTHQLVYTVFTDDQRYLTFVRTWQ